MQIRVKFALQLRGALLQNKKAMFSLYLKMHVCEREDCHYTFSDLSFLRPPGLQKCYTVSSKMLEKVQVASWLKILFWFLLNQNQS